MQSTMRLSRYKATDMTGVDKLATVLVRIGRRPHYDTFYAGACVATAEEIAALLGVSELVARRALGRAGRFVPVPSTEHDETEPVYVAVITTKTGRRYG